MSTTHLRLLAAALTQTLAGGAADVSNVKALRVWFSGGAVYRIDNVRAE